MTNIPVFHLDDDPFYLEEFRDKLMATSAEFDLSSFERCDDLIDRIKHHQGSAVIVLDINLREGDMDGQQLVTHLRKNFSDLIILMCSDLNDPETVRRSLEWGADDFIFKGLDESNLFKQIQSLSERQAKKKPTSRKKELVTNSISEIKDRIPKIIHSAITAVHVHGESGTGKEYVSELFETALPANTPFNRIHCGAISPQLLESELFGHVKGAFTGATANKKGLIEQADGGWIFLDEVATLSQPAQVALLRVLENQQIRPVGASQEKPVHIRIISATNESLSKLVEQGRFRADLWQRLCEATIDLLPLRQRMQEFEDIVKFFCEQMAYGPYHITPGTLNLLSQYDWRRGNIRELRNCLRAMTEGAIDKTLTPAAIPSHIWQAIKPQSQTSASSDQNAITLPLPSQDINYEILTQQLLVELITYLTRKQGPMSIRQLALGLNIPRSTLGGHLKKIKDINLPGSEKLDLLLKK